MTDITGTVNINSSNATGATVYETVDEAKIDVNKKIQNMNAVLVMFVELYNSILDQLETFRIKFDEATASFNKEGQPCDGQEEVLEEEVKESI